MALANMTGFSTTVDSLVTPHQTPLLGPSELVSNEISQPFERSVFMVTFVVSLVGTVTNAINIRVFVEQGLSDSSTIGFLTLSLFDLLGCVTLIPVSLCYLLWLVKGRALQLTCMALTAMPTSYPHVIFSKISNWITVYMAIERSLCVILPLKVKQFFTPKVTTSAIIFIVLFFISFHLPYPVFTRIAWVHHPILNQTIAYAYDTPTAKTILRTTSVTISTLTTCAMVIVFTTTGLMLFKLQQFRSWRQSNLAANTVQHGDKGRDHSHTTDTNPTSKHAPTNTTDKPPKQAQTSKDIELIKSVLVVTTIFLICLSMSHVPGITVATMPGASMSGHNKNLFYMVFAIRFLFDAVNAAVNFFFYVRISSRYKTAFNAVFSKKLQK